MEAIRPDKPAARYAVAVLLSQLLDKLDRSKVPVNAEQYRSVVRHLAAELESLQSDAALPALLSTSPAAAELYENLNYRHAGLCRSPLEASLAAEVEARSVIARAMRVDLGSRPD